MKTTTIAILMTVAASVFTGVAVANRDLGDWRMENLTALAESGQHEGAKAAITWINEHALVLLPEAATLRAEEAVAGLILAGSDGRVATR